MWIFYLALGVIFLAVVIYETAQDLRRRQRAAQEADHAATEQLAPARAVSRARSYYRAHELPPAWDVGEITLPAEGREIEVPVYFAPGVGSARHGQAAPPGELHAGNACPEEALWTDIPGYTVKVLVNDKTGVIAAIPCAPPTH